MVEVKKTHVEVKNLEIDVRYLADYMDASEQAKRSIVRDCKYRPLLQHDDARLIISRAIVYGDTTPEHLNERAAWVRNKLATDDFDKKKNHVNADYIRRFAKVVPDMVLPDAELFFPGHPQALKIHGVQVKFAPNILMRRITRTNKLRSGALMLRYAKGKPLSPVAAVYQSSAIYGCLCALGNDDGAEAEKTLCLTLDAQTGLMYEAPGKAVYFFNEMKAICQAIAERWPTIKPPKYAVL